MISSSAKILLRTIAIRHLVLQAIAPPDFTVEQGRLLLQSIKQKEIELGISPQDPNYQKTMVQKFNSTLCTFPS